MRPDEEMNRYMNKTGKNLGCQWGESIMTVRRKLMNCSVCVCVCLMLVWFHCLCSSSSKAFSVPQETTLDPPADLLTEVCASVCVCV